jgi:hypothetical protein
MSAHYLLRFAAGRQHPIGMIVHKPGAYSSAPTEGLLESARDTTRGMALFFWIMLFGSLLILAGAFSPPLAHRRDLTRARICG